MAKTIITSGPEDPEAKAARVAKARAERKARQNMRNLIWSVLASLGVVALLVIVVVRPDTNLVQEIDWQEIAAQSADQLPGEPVSPMLSELWTSNRAEVTKEPGADVTWSIGLLGPEDSYVFVDQGFGANDAWVALRVEQSRSTGDVLLGYAPNQVQWREYDRQDVDSGGLNAYVVVLEQEGSIVVVGGTNARGVTEVANEVSWQLAESNPQ
jgi:hypothetical protein